MCLIACNLGLIFIAKSYSESVETDCVKESLAALLLKLLQQLLNFILHVIRMRDTLTELTDEKGTEGGFLMVVLNIHIDDMNWLVALLLSGIKILQHLVVNSLFTGDDKVKSVLAVLKALWF